VRIIDHLRSSRNLLFTDCSIPDTVEMEDLDSDLEELLKDAPELWTPPTQPTPPDYPYLPGVVLTAEQLVYAAGRDKKRLIDALQEILEDMLTWLKDDISSSEASAPRTSS